MCLRAHICIYFFSIARKLSPYHGTAAVSVVFFGVRLLYAPIVPKGTPLDTRYLSYMQQFSAHIYMIHTHTIYIFIIDSHTMRHHARPPLPLPLSSLVLSCLALPCLLLPVACVPTTHFTHLSERCSTCRHHWSTPVRPGYTSSTLTCTPRRACQGSAARALPCLG